MRAWRTSARRCSSVNNGRERYRTLSHRRPMKTRPVVCLRCASIVHIAMPASARIGSSRRRHERRKHAQGGAKSPVGSGIPNVHEILGSTVAGFGTGAPESPAGPILKARRRTAPDGSRGRGGRSGMRWRAGGAFAPRRTSGSLRGCARPAVVRPRRVLPVIYPTTESGAHGLWHYSIVRYDAALRR
jgi:hypothetical protein